MNCKNIGRMVIFMNGPGLLLSSFAAVFLFSDFFDAFGFGAVFAELGVFEQFAQLPPGVKAIQALAAAFLDLDG